MSSTIFQSFQSKEALPVLQPDSKEQEGGGVRRRLSSLSLKIHPITTSSSCYSGAESSWGAFCRSKSVSSMGEYAGSSIRKWWDWSWAWILSRKPSFAKDLEMNEEETAILGCHNKGSWRHVFYKLKSEFTRLLPSNHNLTLPQTFRVDSFNNTTTTTTTKNNHYSTRYY